MNKKNEPLVENVQKMEGDTKSDSSFNIKGEKNEKLKIFKKDLKYYKQKYNLSDSDFEFENEDNLKTDMERYEEAVKNGQWREHELFNIY